MKRLIGMLTALILFLTAASAFADTANPVSDPLASMEFNIVGLGLNASPDYQAVPRGIATKVDTSFNAGDLDISALVSQLPKDYTVHADFTGPGMSAPLSLVTQPGHPFDLPTLAVLGKYTLSNIRLCDGQGNTLFGAVPQAVAIESISSPLITNITSRPLTLQEIKDRGITFDSTNFTVYEFTAGIATESQQVPLTIPVLIPNPPQPNSTSTEDLSDLLNLGNDLSGIPRFDNSNIPRDMTVAPFVMTVDDLDELGNVTLPTIPGIVAIPGNIGFLHQYFSVLTIVTNGAPSQSNLVIKNVQAKIVLPAGDDLTPQTNDDPLRLANTGGGTNPEVCTILNAGPDGKYGTSDDTGLLNPGETGQADFTLEGVKEGTHKVDFEITATLEGLPVGPVTLKGKATGVVLVRNPNFAVTLGHPATVRTGQEYDLFVTLNNTGKTVANLVSLHLDRQALSGAAFVAGETPDKQIERILPGDSATVKYRLRAQLTGKVTATAFESDTVTGRFTLRAGVGENNIPLSPDSLIIPYTDHLPNDVVSSTVDFLGQAWGVATAPPGAVPKGLLLIPNDSVTGKANALSEAGMRVLFGDSTLKAVQDLTFDLLGSGDTDISLDFLRRKSNSALAVNTAVAAVFQQEIGTSGMFEFQRGLAEKVTDRAGHISLITSDAPVRVRITDADGNAIGSSGAGGAFRDIPFSDQFTLADTGSTRSTLSLITQLNSASYNAAILAEQDATLDLGVVVTNGAGSLQQLRFSGVALPAGATGKLLLLPGTDNQYRLAVDDNGDGATDRFIAPDAPVVIAPYLPHLVSATRIVPGYGPGGDKHGRNIAVLFSGKVTPESALALSNYQVDGNAVQQAVLQPSGRLAFLLLRDGVGPFVARKVSVANLAAPSGATMPAPETTGIAIPAVPAPIPAGLVSGAVRSAKGEAIPGATVRLYQKVKYSFDGFNIESLYAVVSEKAAASDGSFQFDFVLQNDDPAEPFKIEAINPGTKESAPIIASILYDKQQLNLDLFMKAHGSVTGTVRDGAGTPIPNARIKLTTVNDGNFYNAVADGAGLFVFTGVSVGPFSLQAASDATASSGTVMGTVPDDGSSVNRDVVISPDASLSTGTVSGRVFDSDGITLRPGIVVAVTAPGDFQSWIRSAADGSFSFNGVKPGAVTVNAQDAVTGESAAARVTLQTAGSVQANLILAGTGSVKGTVQRGGDKPVAELYVVATVVPANAAGAPAVEVKRSVQTDASGSFAFPSLPVGQVRLEVLDNKDQNRTLVTGSVSLLNKGATVSTILNVPDKLFVSGTIQGTVYDRNGNPWQNAPVQLLLSDTSFMPVAMKEGSAFYTIPNLPLGNYRIVVQGDKGLVNATATLWFDGQTQDLDLRPLSVGTVTGKIFDDEAKASPTGADVTLSSPQPNKVGWLATGRSTTKSDPKTGTYLFPNVYLGNFSVSASNVLRPVPAVAGGSLNAAGDAATVDLSLKGGDGQVNAPGSVSGTVVLPDGTAAGGVKITLYFNGTSGTWQTDAGGTFQIPKIIPAGSARLVAEDPTTTLTWQGSVSVPAGADVPVNIRLLGRGDLAVTVVGADGAPVVGAKVAATGTLFPNDNATDVTGAGGLITFHNLSEGAYAVSAADDQGHAGATTAQISVDKSTVPVSITLAAYGSVSGHFFAADGVSPVQGGQIKLLRMGQVIGYAVTSTGADPGSFLVDNVPLGDFTLEGYDPATERYGAGGGTLSTNGTTAKADVVYIPIGTVQGSVLNNSGSAPVPGASVSIHSLRNYNFTTVTAPDGSFSFAGVPAQQFRIEASDPSGNLHGETAGTVDFENQTANVEVRLGPVGSIVGRILMPDGITSAGNVQVNLSTGAAVQSDANNGSFRFDNLAAGKSYTVTASQAVTRRTGSAIFTVEGDGTAAVGDVVLQGIGSVQVTVLVKDPNTQEPGPLSGASVALTSSSFTDTCSTQEDGVCVFTKIPAGTFSLKAAHAPDVVGAAGSGTVGKDGEQVAVTLTMGPIGTVKGKVVMADGVTPSRGGGVRLDGGGMTFSGATDSDGNFTFSGIPVPFNFSLRTEDPTGHGAAKASGSILNNGDTADFGVLVLDERRLSVTGTDPASGALNVALNTQVKVIFSAPADHGTVTSSSLTLLQGSSAVAGTLQFDADNTAATFTPSAPLKGFTLYTLVVSDAITDRFGRQLTEGKSFSFTTVDATPPTLLSVSPASGTVQVEGNQTVRLTFSEPLDSQSLQGVVLRSAAGDSVDTRTDLIQGGMVVVLTPMEPLQFNSTYSISAAGVRDLAGNEMADSFQSFFATLDTIAPTVTALTVPADAILVKGNAVPFTATVPDTDAASVAFYLDDQLVATIQSRPYTLPILLSRDGSVRYKAIAQDRFQNQGMPAYLDLTIDATSPQVAASPGGAAYKAEQIVELSMDRPGSIFYTTDSTDPNENSAVYSGAIPISVTTTLKFFGKDVAGNKTAIRTESYVIDKNPPVTQATPAGGYYGSVQEVTLSCNDWESGCGETYYCLGTNCAPASLYLGSIRIDASQVLRFYSKDKAGNGEAVKESTYTIGMAVSASPSTIPDDYQGQIAVGISNLASAGSTVLVEQVVDANENGSVDGSDYVVRSFSVADGARTPNPNVQEDEDGAQDASVRTSLNYYLLNDIYHAPGRYIFKVTSGGNVATAPFAVTAVAASQSISGTVSVNSAPVPGAIVQLTDKWQRPAGYTLADQNGRYILNVKTPGDYLLVPVSYGYATKVATPVSLAAGQVVTGQDLTLTPGEFQVSGQVKDAATGAGIGGLWVRASGTDGSGVAMTNSNGSYILTLPAGGYSVAVAADPMVPHPSSKGYLAFNKQALAATVSADTVVPDITLPFADVVVSGRVLSAQGTATPGMPVQGVLPAATDVREPLGFGVTNTDGDYKLGISSGNGWQLSLEDSAAQGLGFIGYRIQNFSTTSTPLTGNDLTLYPITAWIQGTVRDSNSNLLAGADLQLRNSDSSMSAKARTAADGTYRIGTFAGSWLLDEVTHNKVNQSLEQAVTLMNGENATADFVVDVTPPSLVIDAVSTPTTSNFQTLTGTVEAGSTIGVTADTAAIVGPVSYPTPSTWSCTVTGLVAGDAGNQINVTATDAAGNTTTATAQIRFVQSYTITASAGPNGTVSPPGITTLLSGGSQTYSITPNPGYHVSEVTADTVSQGALTSYAFSNVTANHTIAASFALNTYTISATAGTGGSITPASAQVNYGGSQNFTITPATGYTVANVLVDGISVGAVTSYQCNNVSSDHTITATFLKQLPDLAVTAMTPPATAVPGQQVTVPMTISNIGSSSTGANFSVGLYLCTTSNISTSCTSMGTKIFAALGAGAQQSTNFSATVPGVKSGTYFIGVIADSSNSITESVETNNSLAGTPTTILKGPDLAMTAVTPPATASVGQQITVPVTVKNLGIGSTLSSFYVDLYLCPTSTISTSCTTLRSSLVGALAAGAQQAFNVVTTVPRVTSGTYYIGAIVDSSNTIEESNEANNALAGTPTVIQ